MNGAVYEPTTDIWFPYQWDMNGFYAAKESALDLVNRK